MKNIILKNKNKGQKSNNKLDCPSAVSDPGRVGTAWLYKLYRQKQS